MIEISGLKKRFGDLEVLKGIDLKIDSGDIVGIIGRSGAGKSTLLRCMNGLEKYDEGRLTVDGKEVSSLSDHEMRLLRRRVGMIFQNFSLTERDSVYKNVALPMKCWKFDKKDIAHRSDRMLDLVGLSDKRNSKPRELSGGQKQRVAIARTLAMETQILLCDEATSSLDPNTTRSILDLLKEINQKFNLTIVLVTHEMSVIREVCNKIAILDQGKVASFGLIEDVFMEQSPALIRVLGENQEVSLPDTGVNIKVLISSNTTKMNLISCLSREISADVDILWANMDRYTSGTLGEYILNVQESDSMKVQDFLSKNQVAWEVV